MERPRNKPGSKEEVMKSLPKELHQVYLQLVNEYKFHCIKRHGSPFVSYQILAGLILDGWRPTHAPFVEFELGEGKKKV